MADQLTHEQIADFKDAFVMYDSQGNGEISAKDLGHVMRSLGRNPTEAELQDMINEVDQNSTGRITFPEFLSLMGRCHYSGSDYDAEEELKECLRAFDTEGDGFIHSSSLRHALVKCGEFSSVKEIDDFFLDVAVDELADDEGRVNCEEFVKMMMSV
eukprot:PhF_6_TR31806/c0_g1_i1/m.46922/K02183/CALM; calmodulin